MEKLNGSSFPWFSQIKVTLQVIRIRIIFSFTLCTCMCQSVKGLMWRRWPSAEFVERQFQHCTIINLYVYVHVNVIEFVFTDEE